MRRARRGPEPIYHGFAADRLDRLVDWMSSRRMRVHLAYNGDNTDVYVGFHASRLVITASWIGPRADISDVITPNILIHEMAHTLAERDESRLKLPNFGMVRYTQPFSERGWQTRLDPGTEILTEARAQAIAKALCLELGFTEPGVVPQPIKVDPVKSLYGLDFTRAQSDAIIQEHASELALLAADRDVLAKLEETVARASMACRRSA